MVLTLSSWVSSNTGREPENCVALRRSNSSTSASPCRVRTVTGFAARVRISGRRASESSNHTGTRARARLRATPRPLAPAPSTTAGVSTTINPPPAAASGLERVSINGIVAGHARLPGTFAGDIVVPVGNDRVPGLGSLQQPDQAARERLIRARREKMTIVAIAYQLPVSSHIRSHHQLAHGHGLQRLQRRHQIRQSARNPWIDHDIHGAVITGHFAVWYAAG